MKGCRETKKNMAAFLGGEMDPQQQEKLETHLKRCSSCQKEMRAMEKVFKSAESLTPEIEEVVSSVNWDRLPAKIADAMTKEPGGSEWHAPQREHRGMFLQPWFRPVAAALLVGVLLGAISTVLVLRPVRVERASSRKFTAPEDFLERVEIEMARRETIKYLDKSQFLLLEFIQNTPESPSPLWQDDFSSKNIRSLLSKKKYIDPQLDKFKMVKAKAICDQVELLFYELAQIRDVMTDEEIQEIQNYIQDKQLLLRIKLVKRELEKSEI